MFMHIECTEGIAIGTEIGTPGVGEIVSIIVGIEACGAVVGVGVDVDVGTLVGGVDMLMALIEKVIEYSIKSLSSCIVLAVDFVDALSLVLRLSLTSFPFQNFSSSLFVRPPSITLLTNITFLFRRSAVLLPEADAIKQRHAATIRQ
jgi:hypothetical protein